MNTSVQTAPVASMTGAIVGPGQTTASNVHQLLNISKQLSSGSNNGTPRYPQSGLTLPQQAGKPSVSVAVSKSAVNPTATALGLTQQDAAETFRSLSATLSSLNSYTISLQNQLNLAAAKSATALAAGPTLAQAASVLSQANTLAQTISLYQQQQQQQQHHQQQQQQQSSLAIIQSSLAAAAASSAVVSSSTSTCNLNNTLFVGNLHASLQEIDLIQVFRPFGRIVECCKKWLHFGFVKFMSEEEACHAYVTLNGFRLKGRPMRLEFQNRTKKAILAQAGLTNVQGASHQPGATAPNPNDLLSMSSTLNGLNGLPFVPSSSSSSSSSSGSSTPFLTEGASFGQFPAYSASSSASSSSSNLSSSNSSSNLNTYFQALTGSLYGGSSAQGNSLLSAATGQKSTTLEEQAAAALSFFNPDQLIKFANGTGVSEQTVDKADFGLGALNDEAIGARAAFEFKLNDELIKDFPSTDKIGENGVVDDLSNLLKKSNLVSPSYSSSSPQHDLSGSSDSGCCRSNSFLNDEDSACCSLSTSTVPVSVAAVKQPKSATSAKNADSSDFLEVKKQHLVADELTISEHMEFTCSNESSSPAESIKPESSSSSSSSAAEDDDDVPGDEEDNNLIDSDSDDGDDDESDCDTSDDASEIPTDTECLNEIDDLIDENFLLNADEEKDTYPHLSTSLSFPPFDIYNQVVDDDGSVERKKLSSGIYKCINQTLSLFIEPNDVLKPMSSDEFNEYVLFPNRIVDITMPAGCSASGETSTTSYFVLKNAQVYLM